MPVTGSKVVDMLEEVTNLKWSSQRVMAHGKAVYRGIRSRRSPPSTRTRRWKR